MPRSAFGALAERHRRELHVHCYRMLGSFEEAEDPCRRRSCARGAPRQFDGGATCGLALQDRDQRLPGRDPRAASGEALTSIADVPWLQPYPDRLLDEIAPSEEEPDAVVVARETIELAYWR